MNLNLTNELSNLLYFTGETATAIRLYSCYAKSHREFTQQDSLDVMFLSNVLHHFSQIHTKIIECAETGKSEILASACQRLINLIEDMLNPAMQEPSRNALATFCNPRIASLVDLNLAIGSLKAIIEKCDG